MNKTKQRNVLGEPLEVCGENPITGYFRDGCCNTDTSDIGSHTVCIKVTNDFLEFSKNQGNDLSTRDLNMVLMDLKMEIPGVFVQTGGSRHIKMG